ncbi:hypothetical protein D3C80_2080910 [compost metagenome]
MLEVVQQHGGCLVGNAREKNRGPPYGHGRATGFAIDRGLDRLDEGFEGDVVSGDLFT